MGFRKASLTAVVVVAMCATGSMYAQQADDATGHLEEAKVKADMKVPANPRLDAAMDAFFSARMFEQTAISPDGKTVAWVETLAGKDGSPGGGSAIYVTELGNLAPARISAGSGATPHSEGSVAWSPDSKRLAFVSDAASPGQAQLYLWSAGDGAARRLTNVKGLLATPRWAPNGKTIAVLFTEGVTRPAGPLASEPAETGEIKDAFFEQRLALVDVASGELRQISPEDMHVYEYGWGPDSRRIVATAAHGNGDNNWWIAQLYILDVDRAGTMKPIYKPSLQIARPSFSPDGEKVAFIEGLMSDEDSVGGDVFMIPAAGGEAKNVTPGMRASANWLAWMPDDKILFTGPAEGEAQVATVDLSKERISTIWRGPEQLSAGLWGTNVSLAADGKTSAAVRSSVSTPPEVWAGTLGEWKQITHLNSAVKPGWGETRSIRWKSDGYDVQGWLTYPKDFDPVKKYPMIVRVHGGPGDSVQSNWPESWQFPIALSAAGYFVLQPNPRGSFGQGEAFTRANVRDFGYGDFRDILAGVDEALRVAPIDPNRLGLTGWSYGGFMTMWGVTQTNRFKAAMAGAGIANYQSYYGENKIDQWMIPFFGKSVYDDPEIYARSSPINFIKNVKTPTLIIVGDSDGECPTPQSYEFWHALKAMGVETTLVVYEHEGHKFANPEHERDRIRRTVAWFDAHLR